ncbi:ABC transporter ATP-binding protein [Dysgonomonas sp. 216]|uniref:ribosomal protection-like ABC-F family protein n=1 Tax=Dysgonomonas sp. 216 TaxID=2302934 RepID=UPI0013D065D2|nr:ABC-F family ATP-binding cassette domain-containing protein [Dysgonomonas sp. 216]NDW19248.1 ABC transporter ATP-binding protein [Dysgonomonas sp. 216]
MSIILKDLTYIHPDRELLFQNINLNVNNGNKIGLVGNNGAGKSTLLQIISGVLQPTMGEVIVSSDPYYIPQHFGQFNEKTVAQALGIDVKLKALQAIIGGDASLENFTVLDDDWDIEEKALAALDYWGLHNIDLYQRLDELSGGEKTKVFLTGIKLHNPEIVLLDEPTNHLDWDSRQQLYKFVEAYNGTFIIVSHDRVLLNRLNLTCELGQNGIEVFGGNYDFYKEQKEGKLDALKAQQDEKEKALRKANKIAREAIERKQKQDSKGAKKKEKEGVARIMMNTIRNRAEQSGAKLKDVHADKIEKLRTELTQIRGDLSVTQELQLGFGNSQLHTGKILVSAREINFRYASENLWQKPFDFVISSGDKIVVRGENGSGKTTLIKLILGVIPPSEGSLERAEFKSLYLDQEYSIIDNNLTVFEQVQKFNTRKLLEHEVKTLLHRFLFPSDTWNKPCSKLSGGEKMKLIFCSLIVDNNTPDMIILDEPTNNLDIQSLEIVTSAIKGYKGTLLVVSHDQYFIDEIGVDSVLELSKKSI